MKSSGFLKILFLLLLPSAALLAVVWIYRPEYYSLQISLTLVGLASALLATSAIGGVLSPSFSRKHFNKEIPSLLRDLIRYSVFILVSTLLLRTIWGDVISPVLGALGIGGVVLGFALQETLSNFFAGLALLLEKPFTQGDWIRIGNNPEGVVEHITWRATKVRTRDNDYQIYPNSVVAKEVITNFRQPSPVHTLRIRIGASYKDSPDLVKRTLLDILPGVPLVLRKPEPSILLKEYADSSIIYEMRCSIEEYSRRTQIENEILHRVWFAFRRNGIEIPFPIRTIYQSPLPGAGADAPGEGEKKSRLESAVLAVPIFSALGKEERARLVSEARLMDFSGGEAVIQQGDAGDTLYTILSGSARVAVRGEDGAEKVVSKLRAGEFFGEMSLLTGDPRTASVYAEEPLLLCAVSKGALLPILQSNPQIAEKIAELVTLRREGLDAARAEAALQAGESSEVRKASRRLFDRIKLFFGIA